MLMRGENDRADRVPTPPNSHLFQSLAIASGHLDFLFATVFALLCEPKRHLPFNQLSVGSTPLPRNLQTLALAVQRQLLNVPPGPHEPVWIGEPLERRPIVCEFEVIYTGRAMMEEEAEGEQGHGDADEQLRQGCLASDGTLALPETQNPFLSPTIPSICTLICLFSFLQICPSPTSSNYNFLLLSF